MSAAEIKAWRESRKLTQAQLASLLGLKSGAVTISSWECGRASPQPYLREALETIGKRLSRERAEEMLGQGQPDLLGDL